VKQRQHVISSWGRLGPLLAVTALAATLPACGGEDAGPASSPGGELSGSIRVDGSSTVAPLSTAAAELFNKDQPNVQVTVGTAGTGGGFKKFCAGETDISDASRPIHKDDADEGVACDNNGIRYEEFAVANDALTVVVSKDNTWAHCLTVAQLKKIWEPKSKVNNWNQVDPDFPAEPLALFGPGTDSGTFDYFTAEINGAEGASRTDFTASEDDDVIAQGVSGSTGGLGYFGFSHFEENQAKLKALKIDGGNGCIAPSPETAQDATYKPLSRPLFIYPSAKALSRPEVLAFVESYVENHILIALNAKFIPLDVTQAGELKNDLDWLRSQAGS
jgi:phosphate transport system substrate-binding protein